MVQFACFLAFGTCVLPGGAIDAAAQTSSEADRDWKIILLEAKKFLTASTVDPVQQIAAREVRTRRYRNLGLVFYRKFPRDPRRLEWLEQTLKAPPRYWQDIGVGAASYASNGYFCGPVNTAARMEWEQVYQNELRPALFSSPEVGEQSKAQFLLLELREKGDKTIEHLSCGRAADTAGFLSALLSYAAHSASGEGWSRLYGGQLFELLEREEADTETQIAAIRELKKSPSESLRLLADGRERILKMQVSPVDFKFMVGDGEEIDMSALRGKVVLIDGWSNWCSSCIEALPRIKRVRDRYRDAGFEVVGITFAGVGYIKDSKADESKILRAIAESGADWPTTMLKDAAARQFLDDYGITGFPFTWVVGRDGKLLSTRPLHGDLMESEIRRHLGLPPLDGAQATAGTKH